MNKELMIGPIKDFAIGIYDGPHATPPESNEGPVFLGIKNITPDGRLDLSDIRHISENDFSKWTKRVTPEPDDIVFSYEATLHRYALIPEGLKCCLGRRMALVRPNKEKVYPHFLYYYFLSPKWKEVVSSNIISGATVDRIPIIKFPDFEIRVPTRPTQIRIANILVAYDKLIENNQRRIALLEQAARLLYQEWFVHLRFPGHEHAKITDGVPEGWEKKTINDVCKTVGGGTPSTNKPEYWQDGDIIWVVPTDITRNRCLALLDSEKKITHAGLQNSSAKLVPPDTILMTSRASVGFFGLIDKEVCTNQGFINIIPIADNMRMYLLYNLINRVEEIRANAGGSTYKEISKGRFQMMNIIIPTDQLLNAFEEKVYSIFQQVRILHKQAFKLAEARDLLLPRLMNGEISV